MIKRILGIIIPLMICATLVAQDTPNIYGVNYFKPKADQREEYLAGLKDHTKKHHSKGIMKVRTYQVVSGDKAGWYVRVSGPLTWADVDKFQADIRSKAHSSHAAKFVRPYIEERIGTMYWIPMEGLHYNRSTSDKPSNMTRVQFTHLNPGMSGEFYDLRRRYNEVLEKTNSEASFTMGHLIHGGERHAIYATFRGMDSWADMAPTGASLSSRYNEVYGNGAWGRFLKQVSKITKKSHDEMRVYMKDYSTR
jgi:hypothetical protein